MAPQQCPACGRFLTTAFIESLQHEDGACPRCADTLRSGMFDGTEHPVVPVGGSEGASASIEPPAGETSVRPPDLAPAAVRDRASEVLAGWDVGVDAVEVASWNRDRRPVPTEMITVVGAVVVGLVLGSIAARDHPVGGASLGALGGLTGAALGLRIWRLEG